MSAKVLKVILKGEDWTFAKKYLLYDEVILNENSERVQECIQDARECLKVTAEDAEVKASLVLR
jgi:hypothetical protein